MLAQDRSALQLLLSSSKPQSSSKKKRHNRHKLRKKGKKNNGNDETASRQPFLSQSKCDNNSIDNLVAQNDMLESSGLIHCQNSFEASLNACSQAGNATGALEILSAMHEAGCKPMIEHYSTTIVNMCRSDEKNKKSFWRQALRIQQSVGVGVAGDLPLETYNMLLSCLARHKRWKEQIQTIQHLERTSSVNRTLPSLASYLIAIECCVSNKQPHFAAQLLQSSIDVAKLTPSTHMFWIVIAALSERLQWRKCLQLLDMMTTLKVQRSLAIYNAILTSCSRSKEPARAKSLLLQMRRIDGIQPDIQSFNSVVSACASKSRWKDALRILDQAHRQPGVSPDVYTYTNAIRACAKGHQRSRALALLQVMKDKGLPLDVYSYTAAIEACDWKGALQLMEEMKEKGIEPSEVTYSVAMKACGQSGKWRIALELLGSMRSKGIPINVYVYNAAITAISKSAKQRGKHSFEHTGDLSVEVKKLMQEMKNDGIVPDGFTYTTAISCAGQEGRWEEALDFFEQMQQGGPRTQPNKVAYTAAIASCAKVGKADEALNLFEKMQEQGISADLVAYNALFAALRSGKKPDTAYRYWNELLRVSHRTSLSSKSPLGSSMQPDIITLTE